MIFKILDTVSVTTSYSNSSIKHPDIGGKKFIVDELVTKNLSPEEVLFNAINGNIACENFIKRREDFRTDFNKIFNRYYVQT